VVRDLNQIINIVLDVDLDYNVRCLYIMSIVSGFFNQNIDTIYSVAYDGYGDVTQTTKYTNVPCRWSETVGEAITAEGQTITYTVEAWIDPQYTDLDESYEISFNSTGTATTYKILAYSKVRGIYGKIDHIKLFLT